ncbi:MAG: hypothetical protein QXT73_01135 [Candidatus Methanomethylicaceae archaeon]
MPEKVTQFSDPSAQTYDGNDRIKWVEFEAGQVFPRRGGKAVQLNTKYRAAVTNASKLAGFLEVDAVGVSGGHPITTENGTLLPVNFGLDKTCVFPTSNRKATETDVGRDFNIVVASNVQYVNMFGSVNGVLRITKVIDDGDYVAVRIVDSARAGNL